MISPTLEEWVSSPPPLSSAGLHQQLSSLHCACPPDPLYLAKYWLRRRNARHGRYGYVRLNRGDAYLLQGEYFGRLTDLIHRRRR
jgi:hypothetical protein